MIIQCATCGVDIKLSPSKVKERNYCSPECAGKRVPRVRSECANCGKELLLKPSAVKENNYCSRKCQHLGISKKVRTKCANCGVDIKRPPSEIKKKNYCSKECRYQGQSKKTLIKCDNCGNDFYRKLSEIKEKNYCSLKCNGKSQSLKVQTKCATCGKDIERKLSKIKKKNYCSPECKFKDCSSNIETTVEEHLNQGGFQEGVDYFTQKWLQSGRDYPEGNFGMRPDFYLPHLGSNGVVIECNGGYWHADPVCYPDRSKLDTKQKELVQRYDRKLRYLRSQNIRVLELWERDNDKAEDVVLAPLILLTVCQHAMEAGGGDRIGQQV